MRSNQIVHVLILNHAIRSFTFATSLASLLWIYTTVLFSFFFFLLHVLPLPILRVVADWLMQISVSDPLSIIQSFLNSILMSELSFHLPLFLCLYIEKLFCRRLHWFFKSQARISCFPIFQLQPTKPLDSGLRFRLIHRPPAASSLSYYM